MEEIKKYGKWGILALGIGGAGGVVGGSFERAIHFVTEYRMEHPWLMLLLPLAACIIGLFYAWCQKYGALSTDRVILAVQGKTQVPWILAPLIYCASTLSHLVGASVGREGAALQLGGSIGGTLAQWFRCDEREGRIMVMAGMASVFSALFGTPLAAAVFAMEVARRERVDTRALLPCTVASLTGYRVAVLIGATPVRYARVVMPAFDLWLFLKITVLAILCGIVSWMFYTAIHKGEALSARVVKNRYLRGVVLSLVLLGMTALLGVDYNGVGSGIIETALGGSAKFEAFALKILFTAISIAAGFKGGEIVPAFFVGSTFGCVMGSLLGLPPELAAAVGFVCVFCGAVKCPIASLLLAAEVFSGSGVALFAYACTIAFLTSGRGSLYSAQERRENRDS